MAGQKISNATHIQKIRKNAPFDLSVITAEYPQFSQLIAVAVGQLDELPDFSDDSKNCCDVRLRW